MRCCSGALEQTVPETTDLDPEAPPALETPDEVVTDVGDVSLFVNSCRTALDFTVAATAGWRLVVVVTVMAVAELAEVTAVTREGLSWEESRELSSPADCCSSLPA